MPFLKLPKFNIKNLILLVVLLTVSSLISLVGRLMVNKNQLPTVPTAQAQSCWTQPTVWGGEGCDCGNESAGSESSESESCSEGCGE